MDLGSTWDGLYASIPAGWLVVARTIGIAMLVASLVWWMWRSRRGGGLRLVSLPALVVALTLIAPGMVVPVLLSVVSMLVGIGSAVVGWAASLLAGG